MLKVTDYLNRGYLSPRMGQICGTVHRLFPQPAHRRQHPLPQELFARRGLAARCRQTIYQLPLDDGRKVPVNLYILRKDLDEQLVAVLVPVARPHRGQRILGQVLSGL